MSDTEFRISDVETESMRIVILRLFQADDLVEKVAALGARIDAMDQVLEWLGLTLAIVGVGFGALITLTVVFFALRTEQTAVAAAREELRSSKGSIDQDVLAARSSAETAQAAAKEIEDHRQRVALRSEEIEANADQIREILKKSAASLEGEGSEPKLTQKEKEALSAAALRLQDKPRKDLSAEEFEILMTEARQAEDWDQVVELAQLTRLLHQSDKAASRALGDEAVALDRLGKSEQAKERLDDLLRRFQASDSPPVQDQVIRALYNKATILGENDKGSMNLLEQAINLSRTHETPASLTILPRALNNRGIRYLSAGKIHEAMSDFDEALRLTESGKFEDVYDILPRAFFNKARGHQALGQKPEGIEMVDQAIALISKSNRQDLQGVLKSAERLKKELSSS